MRFANSSKPRHHKLQTPFSRLKLKNYDLRIATHDVNPEEQEVCKQIRRFVKFGQFERPNDSKVNLHM